MRFHLALGVSAILGVLALPAVASAVPGDPEISHSYGDQFRLSDYSLEPGCFVPSRYGDVDLSSHIDLTYLSDGEFVKELHVSVDSDAPFSVDQVLVPSIKDGYSVYNTFDTGTVDDDDDIDPNQTGVDLFAPDSDDKHGPDYIDLDDVIVCVSDHGPAQNEPYEQQDGGLVSAKNRPIITPHVTALGQSAITNLKTYKLGFGYSVEKWFTAPTYDGARPYHIPAFLRIDIREDTGVFDARRVNDVDQPGEDFGNPKADYGQTTLFKREGDMTAWTSSNNNNPDTLAHLVTFNAQGDLPMSWTLRPTLAAPSSLRKVTFTDDDFRAWEASWQAYYCGTGSKPTLPLAPGTNSPDVRDCAASPVNSPETRPASGAPQVVMVTPAAASSNGGACQGYRLVRVKFGKKATAGKIRYNGRTVRAKMWDGRLRATAKLLGATAASPSARTKIVKMTKRNGSWSSSTLRLKICA